MCGAFGNFLVLCPCCNQYWQTSIFIILKNPVNTILNNHQYTTNVSKISTDIAIKYLKQKHPLR